MNQTQAPSKELFGHPAGLFYLFFAELWERFSFYGMRALLTLYMVNEIFEALVNRDTAAALFTLLMGHWSMLPLLLVVEFPIPY